MAFLSLTRGNTHVLNQNDFNEGYGVEDCLALIEPPFSYSQANRDGIGCTYSRVEPTQSSLGNAEQETRDL